MTERRRPEAEDDDPIRALLRARHPEPHKSIEELAREQGVLDKPIPDYVALATALWPTEEDVEDFLQYVDEMRNRRRD